MNTTTETLEQERARLAFEASNGDQEAASRLEEIEAELNAADVEAERQRLAQEEKARRSEQEKAELAEAERRKARGELRKAAASREMAAELIEDAVADLIEAIDQFADAGAAIHSLLKPAAVPKRPVGLGGDPIFDSRGAAIWIVTRLYGSNLPKPLPRGPGGTGGSFAESVRSSHRETLPLDDDEEGQR